MSSATADWITEAAGFYGHGDSGRQWHCIGGHAHNNHVERKLRRGAAANKRHLGGPRFSIDTIGPSTGHVVRNNTVVGSGRAWTLAGRRFSGTIGNCFFRKCSSQLSAMGIGGIERLRKNFAFARWPPTCPANMTFFGSIAQIRAGAIHGERLPQPAQRRRLKANIPGGRRRAGNAGSARVSPGFETGPRWDSRTPPAMRRRKPPEKTVASQEKFAVPVALFHSLLPMTAFQIWFRGLSVSPAIPPSTPTWASLANHGSGRNAGDDLWPSGFGVALVILLPLVGGGLVFAERPQRTAEAVFEDCDCDHRTLRLAASRWPLGLWLAGGPLGPKALS